MTCSVQLKTKFVIGCKEGSIFEFDIDTLKNIKRYKAESAINTIEYMQSYLADTFVISQSMPSGYLDPRSKLEVIVSTTRVKEEMLLFHSAVIQSGDINKVVQNTFKINELILATQTGLIFVDLLETQMPEAVMLDPEAQKNWFPDLSLHVSKEKYFEGKRVGQVVQIEKYTLLVSLWDEPGYLILDR